MKQIISSMLLGAALCVTAAGGGAAVLSTAAQAQAKPLDAPRAAGTVGERYDGYAVVRDADASADIRKLVEDSNAERRKVYQDQAASTGAPAEEVGKVYASQIMAAAPAGWWFQGADGTWVQKQ
ncbi:MAG: YdbL family protein [Sphingomonadales bacterium]